MRDPSLHEVLQAFTQDASAQLCAETENGAEIPFELTESDSGRRRAPLYCYRPLTARFIREHLGLLVGLPTYAAAAQALEGMEGAESYLRERGQSRIPSAGRDLADASLRVFLEVVFSERSEFSFDDSRFAAAYAQLENALYAGCRLTTVIVPLLGIALDPDSERLELGDGLALTRGECFRDAPDAAVWGEGGEPNVLAVLDMAEEPVRGSAVAVARGRFRRLLSALRLFESGSYALGPLGWRRSDGGEWRPVALTGSGRSRRLTQISADHEDELRAFCNLFGRRLPHTTGEVAWALSRFEMGCERIAPFEAITDHLLALRGLLEPEGPGSGRLAGRLAAICATEAERGALAERVAHAISLERAVIAGLAPAAPGADALVEELADHLRALLRDLICGHLDPSLCAFADGLLAQPAVAQ